MLNVYANTHAYAITEFAEKNAYTKIVFQDDWVNNHGYSNPNDDDYTDIEIYNCESLVIDLNGHSCDLRGPGIIQHGPYLRVRDSSAAGTGKIIDGLLAVNWDQESYPVVSFVLESGTIDRARVYAGSGTDSTQVHIYGGEMFGNVECEEFYSSGVLFHMEGGSVPGVLVNNRSLNMGDVQMQLSPYISGDFTKIVKDKWYTFVARNLHFAPFEVLPYDYYAVSTSDTFVGAYNYVYGYAWEKTADEMASLAVAADKTYYVWARYRDDWYHCLDLRYTAGKLVVA